MDRRTFLQHGALALTAFPPGRRASAAGSRPPNFIVVLCDDLGYGDIAAFGAKRIRTPHLDRMVREGTALIGKWHLGHVAPFWPPTQQGFDLFFGLPYRSKEIPEPWRSIRKNAAPG